MPCRKYCTNLGTEIPTLSFYGGKGDSVSPDVALKMAASESNSWMLTETPEFLSKVKELGYDGLVGYDEWVKYIAAVSPDQIKSATENIGALDPANPDIRFESGNYRTAGDDARKVGEVGAMRRLPTADGIFC